MKTKLSKNQIITIIGIIVTIIGWFFVNDKHTITTSNSPCSINTNNQNGDNIVDCSIKNTNEYPEPKFAYTIMVPSKMANDGKYHTQFVLTLGIAQGTEDLVGTTTKFNQNYLNMNCKEIILPPRFGPKPTAHIEGTYYPKNFYYDCTSSIPLIDNKSFFSL